MYALEIKGFTKTFGTLVANDNISLTLEKGEVLAILGENGAGKTTLMRGIYGMEVPDSGEMVLSGKRVFIRSPKDAIRHGIGMVHQHFMLINNFTVAENLVLGMTEYTGRLLDRKAINRKINEFFEQYHFDVPADAKVKDLPVGLQQRVEIMKVLFRGAQILVLDEPTAVLTPQETQELFHIIRRLQSEGKSIIFISHKLDEVKAISQRILVLRLGRVSGVVNTSEADENRMARMMIGRELHTEEKPHQSADLIRRRVLKVENLIIKNEKTIAVKGIDFTIFSNEILGVAGVDGNGQKELAEGIAGLCRVESGSILLNGRQIAGKSVKEIRRSKVAHIPEDRRATGLVLGFSISENCILSQHDRPPFAKGMLINKKAMRRFARQCIEDYRIMATSESETAVCLSGGNQQKVIVARELAGDPELLIAMKPTRGLDVGAVEYIHSCLLEQRNKGAAVLLISSELEELMQLSDRIMVMHNGEITGIVYPEQVTAEEIGLMMAGQKRPEPALVPKQGVIA